MAARKRRKRPPKVTTAESVAADLHRLVRDSTPEHPPTPEVLTALLQLMGPADPSPDLEARIKALEGGQVLRSARSRKPSLEGLRTLGRT